MIWIFKATGYCNAGGTILLDLDGAEDGDYNLVVTKHDHVPITEEVSIEQVDYFVDISEVSYDDAAGNGNGIINPGETVDVMVTLANTGNMALSGVTASAECSNDLVTVLSDEITFGDIAAGGTATGAAGFEIEVAAAFQVE